MHQRQAARHATATAEMQTVMRLLLNVTDTGQHVSVEQNALNIEAKQDDNIQGKQWVI